jgi:biotin transport system substrate-specific component
VNSSSSSASAVRPVLADLLPGERVRDALLVGAYAIVIAMSAQVAIPLPGTPVPVTGQTLVVLLGAAALGSTRAVFGASIYGFAGLLGVPWFAVTSGATLGYVAGFVVAAALIGSLARTQLLTTTRGAAGAMVLGNVVIYALGASVLALVLGLGLREALALGVVPFLLGDAVKIALATALLPATQRLIDRQA